MSNITLVDEKVDYLSYQSQEVCRNVTAYEAYKLMTFHQLKWLAGLFKIGDFLEKRVGIKPINVFNKLEETEPDIGSKVHFFTIIKKQKDTLTLTIRDHLLDVCLCIRIIETKDYKINYMSLRQLRFIILGEMIYGTCFNYPSLY